MSPGRSFVIACVTGVLALGSFEIVRADPAAAVRLSGVQSPDLEGTWTGVLDADGTRVRLTVRISQKPDGTFAGVLDSPDQMAFGIPITSISASPEAIRFELKLLQAAYEGRLASDGQTLTGRWHQAGLSWPLNFSRPQADHGVKRPQDPVGPYPAADHVPAAAAALEAGPIRDYGVVKLPGLNHLLQTSTTGRIEEYYWIEETLSPLALDTIRAWIHSRVVR